MGKQHPDQPAWQWRSAPVNAQSASLQALDLIAIPMMVVAFCCWLQAYSATMQPVP